MNKNQANEMNCQTDALLKGSAARKNNLFAKALSRTNKGRPPVWFMRQAGRYHSHYQALKQKHTFMEMCKDPSLATEVTMGPINDFGFDAAILFSDLLFPLEAIGMGLTYEPGPKLAWHLETTEQLKKFQIPERKASPLNRAWFMDFQGQALQKLETVLPNEKGLIGFVGGTLTLFYYAVAGSHAGDLSSPYRGLTDGRWQGFLEIMEPLIADNMILQAKQGAQAVAIFDTCAGELSVADYDRFVVPSLTRVLDLFKAQCPQTPVVYYSKKTGPDHWRQLAGLKFECLGVDWNWPLNQVLRHFGDRYAIQGNVDPSWLHLPKDELEKRLRQVFASLKDENLDGWVCGLGHGVLQHTPEENVRLFLKIQKEVFSCRT